ncbi:General alpha-glucoside permease [Fusarium oxysporum f. sp. cubense]|uniref:General alpha-glucoside permease n=1 Tax=Fusarium oxysporum f. sp. cubense TaxID=61366 RepID=A0A559KVI7_FUSOC|nr:General alpha-glucoside permease [Fusarium oxysporum f. sp. cubense]
MTTEKADSDERGPQSPGQPAYEAAMLVSRAQAADAADRQLTIWQALKKYKKAVLWSTLLSTALIMEGYDVVIINGFFGQPQFAEKFGEYNPATDKKEISAAWQSGLSNSALVGELAGLACNFFATDKFGCRLTYCFFMAWLTCAIFISVFAPSLSVLAFGEAMSGISWGVFQTLTTAYACEIVPTVLRPFVTGYVSLAWGAGILLSSGVLRAVVGLDSSWGWRLPFTLQWVWPVPLFIVALFAPESPWNAVRRGKMEEARRSLVRLRSAGTYTEDDIDATLAYIQHTTEIERLEVEGASFLDCFRGTNLRRTEINIMTWTCQIFDGNPLTSYAVVFLEAAGFSTNATFDLNMCVNACFVIGPLICFSLMPHFGRRTIYMTGLAGMLIILVVIGGLGFSLHHSTKMAIGVLLIICTLINTIFMGATCYPIVAETPSGRLRYKTIAIGRFCYNIAGLIANSITPRMLSASSWNWGAKAGLFYAGTNALCLLWCFFRLPESKGRSFGELDMLFEQRVPARKFKTTSVDEFAHSAVHQKTLDEKEAAFAAVAEHKD